MSDNNNRSFDINNNHEKVSYEPEADKQRKHEIEMEKLKAKNKEMINSSIISKVFLWFIFTAFVFIVFYEIVFWIQVAATQK